MNDSKWKNIKDEDIVHLGQSLKSKNVFKNNPSSPVQEFWFQGGEPYFDVFISKEKQKIIWIQATFRGQFLECKNSSLTYGNTNDFQISSQKSPASKKLQVESELNPEFVELIISMLEESDEYELLEQAAYVLEEALESI